MSPEKNNYEWLKEFESFLKMDGAAPAGSINQTILAHVKADLNPSLKRVSAKLFGLHVIGAFIVSLFCPQLGIGPIFGGHGIMHLFMQYGPLVCATICGAAFLGLSTALATVVLSREELRVAGRYGFLNISLLASVSFAGLMLAGGSADRLAYTFWILGAVVAGLSILKFGAAVRLRPYAGLKAGL